MIIVEIKAFQRVPYICYPVLFKQELVQAFINSNSEINAITPVYVKKLGLWIRKTDVSIQKIDGITLVTYDMVIANFSLKDKYGQNRFFEKIFLMADISMEVVLSMLFVFLSNANVRFVEKKLEWRRYTIIKALAIKKRVELIKYK